MPTNEETRTVKKSSMKNRYKGVLPSEFHLEDHITPLNIPEWTGLNVMSLFAHLLLDCCLGHICLIYAKVGGREMTFCN